MSNFIEQPSSSTSEAIAKALNDYHAQCETELAARTDTESGAKTAPTDPLETVKPLIRNGESVTPPPPSANALKNLLDDLNADPEMIPADADLPRDPPPNVPGRKGTCGATMQRRLPTEDEFIESAAPLCRWASGMRRSHRRNGASWPR